MTVVTPGPAAEDENGRFVVRAFASLAELTAQEVEFEEPMAWRDGLREALVARIGTPVQRCAWRVAAAIEDLRAGNVPPSVAY